MLRLLGSRRFLDLPPGTLYVEYWCHTERECNELIDRFVANPTEFMDTTDLMVYYDNGASLVLDGQKQQDDVVLTDINVVGDADPSCTLRVVFDIDDMPDVIKIRGSTWDEIDEWTKQELLHVVAEVKGDGSVDKKFRDWAFLELDKLSLSGNKIVDIDLAARWG